MQRTNALGTWFSGKISKIDKLLVRSTKGKRGEGVQINKSSDGKRRYYSIYWKNIRDSLDILKKIYFTKLENLKEIYGFLDIYHLAKLNQIEANNLHRYLVPDEIEAII